MSEIDKKIRHSLRQEPRSPSLQAKILKLLEATILEQVLRNHPTLPPAVALQMIRDAGM
jgi:hypothetical protein